VFSIAETKCNHVSGKSWQRPSAELHWFDLDRFADFFADYEESARLHGVGSLPIRQRIRAAAATCTDVMLFLLLSVPLRAIDWLKQLIMSRFSRG
jgi:hypothetical protein